MIERYLRSLNCGLEFAFGRWNCGQIELHTNVQQIRDKPAGMIALFIGLLAEAILKSRLRLAEVSCGDGLILQRGKKFQPNLLVYCGSNLFGNQWSHKVDERERDRRAPESHSLAAATAGVG